MHLDVHTLLYCSVAAIIGFQLVIYSVCLRFLMIAERLLPPDPDFMRRLSMVELEHGLAAGGALFAAGLAGTLPHRRDVAGALEFGDLDPFQVMRFAIPSATAMTLGMLVAAAGLFLSLLKWQLQSRRNS